MENYSADNWDIASNVENSATENEIEAHWKNEVSVRISGGKFATPGVRSPPKEFEEYGMFEYNLIA